MSDNKQAVALPTTVQDLLARRRSMHQRTLNDHVDDIHVFLWDDPKMGPKYQGTLYAVWDEQAIEGSLAADNFLAAQMIRSYATDNRIAQVKDQKLATIVKALNIVLRRYQMTRKERRVTVGDEMVPNGDSE